MAPLRTLHDKASDEKRDWVVPEINQEEVNKHRYPEETLNVDMHEYKKYLEQRVNDIESIADDHIKALMDNKGADV